MLTTSLIALTLVSAAFGAALPGPATLRRRQNAPLFGGWDKGEDVTSLIQDLQVQPNPIDRYVELPASGLFFDFLQAKSFAGGGKDGGVVLADNTIFPETVNDQMSMLVGWLGPCGMVAPHNHPRAAEYLINIAGPNISAGSFNENGSPYFQGNLSAGQVVALPVGSMHYVSNEGCDPAMIVGSFNSASPGVGFLTSMYTALDPETIQAAFGDGGKAAAFDTTKIPLAVNLGHQACLKRCGINSATFDINGKISNQQLMFMAFAGYLKANNFDYNGYNASSFQAFN